MHGGVAGGLSTTMVTPGEPSLKTLLEELMIIPTVAIPVGASSGTITSIRLTGPSILRISVAIASPIDVYWSAEKSFSTPVAYMDTTLPRGAGWLIEFNVPS